MTGLSEWSVNAKRWMESKIRWGFAPDPKARMRAPVKGLRSRR